LSGPTALQVTCPRQRWGYTTYPGTKVPRHTPPQLLLDVMTRQHAAALAYDLFPSFVKLHGDPFLSQTHLTQAFCELRGAYPGRVVVLPTRRRSLTNCCLVPTWSLPVAIQLHLYSPPRAIVTNIPRSSHQLLNRKPALLCQLKSNTLLCDPCTTLSRPHGLYSPASNNSVRQRLRPFHPTSPPSCFHHCCRRHFNHACSTAIRRSRAPRLDANYSPPDPVSRAHTVGRGLLQRQRDFRARSGLPAHR
jgi:hypothetical protein